MAQEEKPITASTEGASFGTSKQGPSMDLSISTGDRWFSQLHEVNSQVIIYTFQQGTFKPF